MILGVPHWVWVLGGAYAVVVLLALGLRRRYPLRETVVALAFLAPSLAVFSVFFYRPFLNLIYWGTFEAHRGGAVQESVGFDQYREELGSDNFREGLWHTVQFIVYTVPAGLVLGVLLAVAANRRLKGIRVFQAIFSSTIATSTAVAAVVFFYLFNPVVGIFQVDWLSDPDMAMVAVAVPGIWQHAGLAFIIVLAGLQAIPDEVMEAATLDGYSAARRLFRVTLPLLSPVLLFLTVVLLIFGFQAFAQIELMTRGGPGDATETTVFKIFRRGAPDSIGIGAVYSVGLFVITVVVTGLQFLLLERRVHYAAGSAVPADRARDGVWGSLRHLAGVVPRALGRLVGLVAGGLWAACVLVGQGLRQVALVVVRPVAPLFAAVGRALRRLAALVPRPIVRLLAVVRRYWLLVGLAVVILAPVFLTLILALSPPNPYREAGRPLHPVAVEWKDRTWWTGGAVSVVLRTAAVGLVLLWVQRRAARRRLGPRQIVAAVAGTAAVVALATPIFEALYDDAQALGWFVIAMVVVAATQLVGFLLPGDRPAWRATLYAALFGVAAVGTVVVAVGAAAWTESWDTGDLGPAMGRSFTVATLITVCQVVTSVLAAYAFAFLRFPLKGAAFAVFVGTLLLPLEVTLLANVQTIRELEWIDTTQALVLPFAATAFGTFLIRQGFRGIPPEIRDAARLDGYGHLAFLSRFAVPLTRPIIASFTVIAAMGAWNQYLWPRAVIDSDQGQTTQIKLRTIVGENLDDANISVAAAVIVAIPVVMLLAAFSRHIIRGLTAGAVKG